MKSWGSIFFFTLLISCSESHMENNARYRIMMPEDFIKIEKSEGFVQVKQLKGNNALLFMSPKGQYYIEPNPAIYPGLFIEDEETLNDMLVKGVYPVPFSPASANFYETNIADVVQFNESIKDRMDLLSKELKIPLEITADLEYLKNLDSAIKKYGLKAARKKLFKSLTVFVGEVIRTKIKAEWIFLVDYPGLNACYIPELLDADNNVYELTYTLDEYFNNKDLDLLYVMDRIMQFKQVFYNYKNQVLKIDNRDWR